MEPLLLWRWFLLLLIPGSVIAGGRIEIDTAIYAHYAITTIKAPFVTGNVSNDVTFNMKIPREALISGFSITTDGLECKATVENLTTVNNLFNQSLLYGDTSGKVTLSSFDGYIETIETTLRVKENTHGFFLLMFEHQVVKDEIHDNFNVKIPVETSEFYDNWSVAMDITGDHRIDRVIPEMEMIHSYYFDDDYEQTDISENFKQNVQNIQQSRKRIFFGGSLTAPNPENEYNYYSGHFSVNYTTDQKDRQKEVFVSETQISAIISKNSKLHANPGRDIVVLLDTSGSMGLEVKLNDSYGKSKLDISLNAVVSTFLKGHKALKEEDRVTLIRFDTNVVNLGTYYGSRRSRIEGKRALENISAAGWTDINGAIHAALNVTDKHIMKGSTDIPLIVLYTDGKPEGTGIETDKTKIRESIKDRNKRCIPIYSIDIGGDDEIDFLTNISQDNCGEAYDYDSDAFLEDNLYEIFEKVRVPVYSSKPEIFIKSNCTEENSVINDLTKLSGKIFTTSGSQLINIPFKIDIPSSQACEVEILYRSIVANKEVEEERKICLPEGRQAGNKYLKYKDSSRECPKNIRGMTEKIPDGTFLDNLREYKDISEKVKTLRETFPNRQSLFNSISQQSLDSSSDIKSLTERAKNAGFVVNGLTGLVVVARSDNGQCENIQTRYAEAGGGVVESHEEIGIRPEDGGGQIRHDQYNCTLRACNKSRFRGMCVEIYDEELTDMTTNFDTLGPDEISSMEITAGEQGNCPGYILYTEENYHGYNKTFKPGKYAGFKELGIFFQETRSLKATSMIRPRPEPNVIN